MEKWYRPVFEDYRYGTTIWSPLAGGILSGKYNDGTAPDGSRYNVSKFAADHIWPRYFGTEEKKANTTKILQTLGAIATELNVSQAQLALAWTLVNSDTSTCIFGATRVDQVEDNIKALDLAQRWTLEIEEKVNTALGNAPEPEVDFRNWTPMKSRRLVALDLNMKDKAVKVSFPAK